ncbi:SMC-Scp complex subunit ScpB [Candidatus Parvarchaeota archaeon]|nr:SMC-Scp complex subunit ScpB [Candidatus Parvarchaeota archaeon]
MSKIKESIEAVIFAFGDGISREDIQKRLKADPVLIDRTVNLLNKEYAERKSAFFISTEGSLYRMRLRSDLVHLAEDNLKTDMKKGVLMTLSLIASKGKETQAKLVKERGSIVYQHIRELVDRGFITKYEEDGKKIVKLTPQFYDYFDVKSSEFKELKNEVLRQEEEKETQEVEYVGN